LGQSLVFYRSIGREQGTDPLSDHRVPVRGRSFPSVRGLWLCPQGRLVALL
jgi:hypothetical protein